LKKAEKMRKEWLVAEMSGLRRPTSAGLETGPLMFSPEEIEKITK